MMAFSQRQDEEEIATLDIDATVVETTKEESLYSYKGYKSYQPINVWWDEKQMVLHTEFRDGNVPAGDGAGDAFPLSHSLYGRKKI
jgi:hypothetical protein